MANITELETSLAVQWLLHAPNTRDPSLISGQGTGSHFLQLIVHMLQLKTSHATTKTLHSQIKEKEKEKTTELEKQQVSFQC